MSSLATFIREAERMRNTVPFARPEMASRPSLPTYETAPSVRPDDRTLAPSFTAPQGAPKLGAERTSLLELRSGSATAWEEAKDVKDVIEAEMLREAEEHPAEMPQQVPVLRQGDSDPGLCLTRSGVEALRQAVSPWPEIMTLTEAAHYLRVGRHAVIDFVRNDDLPATKLAGKWRFKRSMLDHWLEIQFSPYR